MKDMKQQSTEQVLSPVTGNSSCTLVKKVNREQIKQLYGKVDVERFFNGLDYISIYQCDITGYRFYHPYHIAGDSAFYEALQVSPDYYMAWKWEHSEALQFVEKGNRILEVGSGNHVFIERSSKIGAISTGLELNESSIKLGREKQLDIQLETIEQHAKHFSNHYDTIFAFQLLEHLSDVKGFFEASHYLLKPGGKLVVCVPNNDALQFASSIGNIALNCPPHHMGLWNASSLISTGRFFHFQIEKLLFEPLQHYHFDFFRSAALNLLLGKTLLRNVLAKLFINKAFVAKVKGQKALHTVMGNSVFIVYAK